MPQLTFFARQVNNLLVAREDQADNLNSLHNLRRQTDFLIDANKKKE